MSSGNAESGSSQQPGAERVTLGIQLLAIEVDYPAEGVTASAETGARSEMSVDGEGQEVPLRASGTLILRWEDAIRLWPQLRRRHHA